MNYRIYPPEQPENLTVDLPLSKSVCNRALIINGLTHGAQPLKRSSDCDDSIVLDSALNSDSQKINVGAAGTAMRFLTAYFARKEGAIVELDGSERMRKRPISPLVSALKDLGADIRYMSENGFPPVSIRGKRLEGGEVTLDSSVSSQFISALMMIGPNMTRGLRINLDGTTVSLPYIIMTAKMMECAGGEVTLDKKTITVKPTGYREYDWTIESDWSASSYWYELIATSSVSCALIPNLFRNSIQGDSALSRIFETLGVATQFNDDGKSVTLRKADTADGFIELDLSGQPDIAQTVAVACCLLERPFRLTGLSTLPSKETDRLKAIKDESFKLGYDIEILNNDSLLWNGDRHDPATDIRIKTYNDHRMAMSFAPAAIRFPGLIIEDIDVVKKSYPGFWKDLAKAGFKTEETE